MKLDPITNTEPNFGLKRSTKTLYRYATDSHCVSTCSDMPTLFSKTIQDTVHFENGKTLKISKTYDKMGELTDKLYYLRDEAGKWVKSKLQYFKGNKLVKELKGQKNA